MFSMGMAPTSVKTMASDNSVTMAIPMPSTRGMFSTGFSSSSPISIIIPNPWNGMYSVTTASRNGANPSANGSPSSAGNSGG